MKKLTLLMAGLLCLGSAANAQTILSEDFETGNKGDKWQPVAAGAGWTVVSSYSGNNANYNWHNYYSDPKGEYTSATISGECCAGVDAPFVSSTDGNGPREEILLTPELDLNDNYQLEFKFKVSPVNCKDGQRYDLQVRVVTDDNLAGSETIFSIQNEKMLRESGVLVFPITDWNIYTPKIGLEDFKGEKVKLAFVYKMLDEAANVAWLDDVVVKKYTPATGPMAQLSLNRLEFGNIYIGEKVYSDVITLTNAGKDGLTISSVDLPEGLGITLDPSQVNLDTYGHVDFRISYAASMATPASGNVVLHTSGGDVTIAFNATKQFVPDGCTLETFEKYFPPAGWQSNGWNWTTYTLEGDNTVACGGDFSASTLRSPRLDLSNGGSVSFTYFNSFTDEAQYPEYDIELQLSTDGGNSWTPKWTSDYKDGLNKILTETIDLGTGSDNSYIRWFYPAVESDDEGAAPHSTFYLDRVVLPALYGADGVPMAATKPSPANNSEEIYPRDVVLSWAPAQFAKGYKLYVGTNAAADDLINGMDLGNELTYTIPQCAYSTLYRWKVVAYNENGSCDTATTWKFTTQPDASVMEYPYVENFMGDDIPTGWTSQPSADYNRVWEKNSLNPYKTDTETYGVFYTMWLNAGDQNSLTTPEFQLPDDDSMQISFIWGDEHPTDLVVDQTGLQKKTNVEPNNGVSELIFSIYADGQWNEISNLSDEHFDGERKYWVNEKFDLTPYKGKRVQFRWTHKSYRGSDSGGSLTHVVLERILGDKAKFNMASWDAGKVNYDKSIDSGNQFTLLNEGINTLTVKSANFGTPNFSTSLKAGDVIEPDNGLQFSIRFDAIDTAAPVEDDLTVEFESGYKATFPVSATALPLGVYYYSFEPNDLDYKWNEDFTMIDADKAPGYSFSSYWVHYSADGQRCAFSVESDSMEDGMYGMMRPISGQHALVGSSGQQVGADNWIISKKMKATENSTFDFWCRNWESLESVLPDPKHNVTVLVSTTGNTDTKDFEVVLKRTEIPFQHMYEWNHYEVDLSKYADKDIYVALRHTTDGPSNLAFFDDFTFTGFDAAGSGVGEIDAMSDNAQVEVYSLSGVLVAKGFGISTLQGLDKGLYVVRVAENGAMRTFKIAK